MPARKRTRIVIDVNVLVSALINSDEVFLRAIFNKQNTPCSIQIRCWMNSNR